jgi:peptidoglycan/xylan/chitin deacetylase (PgdA/CDA1 family)
VRAHVLMYHGFYEDADASREPRGGRGYSVSLGRFGAQVSALDAAFGNAPATSGELENHRLEGVRWALTFDDGLASAMAAADIVESRGWRAHFFIVSGLLGKPGFMTPEHVVDLHARGHIIGSHSVTHPDPMSGLTHQRLVGEWKGSVEVLSGLLGEPVRVASVPGGSLSRGVIAAAAEAGIDVLFTSEPVSRVRFDEGCAVVGRYAIQNRHEAGDAVALALGRPRACWSQWAGWNARKVARRVLGDSYYVVRARILDRRTPGRR